MVTFPQFDKFYKDWAADLESKGVEFQTSTQVTAILKRDKNGVVLETAPIDPYKPNSKGHKGVFIGEPSAQKFDFLVMAVLADDAKNILGGSATWKEKFVLGGAKFYDDVTITHSDSKYFQNNYETQFKEELCAKPKSDSQEQMIKFAKAESSNDPDGAPAGFRPMYYTHSYAEDPSKIEMSFDCTNYQHQFRTENDNAKAAPMPYENHVFQSIFLDKNNRHLWTIDDIDEDKVIMKKWWHQLGHRWQHYARVVPGMMFINGTKNTYFAGSWTLIVSFQPPFLLPLPPPSSSRSRFFPADKPLSLLSFLTFVLHRTCTNSPASPASPPPIASAPPTRNSTTSPRIFFKSIFCFPMGSFIGRKKRRRGRRWGGGSEIEGEREVRCGGGKGRGGKGRAIGFFCSFFLACVFVFWCRHEWTWMNKDMKYEYEIWIWNMNIEYKIWI